MFYKVFLGLLSARLLLNLHCAKTAGCFFVKKAWTGGNFRGAVICAQEKIQNAWLFRFWRLTLQAAT